MKRSLNGKTPQQVYPQRPWLLRAPALCHVFLLSISSAIWALEWLFEPPIHSVTGSSQAATDEAENLPQLRWLEYPALAPRLSQSVFDRSQTAPGQAIQPLPAIAAATHTAHVDPPVTRESLPVVPPTPWQIEVLMPRASAEKLHAAWQIALQYEQAQSWALAQQAYQDVLQMDDDYWLAWQGLLRIARNNDMPTLETYVQQQLAQRWPVSERQVEE